VLFLLKGQSRRARPCKDSHISIGICRDFISMNIRHCSVNLWLHVSGYIGKGCSARHVKSSKVTIYELHLLIHRCQHHWRHIDINELTYLFNRAIQSWLAQNKTPYLSMFTLRTVHGIPIKSGDVWNLTSQFQRPLNLHIAAAKCKLSILLVSWH